MNRTQTKQIHVGSVAIGGGAPVAVQSMCNTHTSDAHATIEQIARLHDAGCEIIRLAVPDQAAADALPEIVHASPIPVVADIHFDYRLALAAAKAGVHKIRINPGNIGEPDNVRKVAEACRERGIPIRIGVNGGSLEKRLLEKYGHPTPEALVESAQGHIDLLHRYDFDDIALSMKSSTVPLTIAAYRLAAERFPYPLHVGVTETGTAYNGIIRSAVGIGTLLSEGIGDTIRVSLTEAPEHEIPVARLLVEHFAQRPGEFPVRHPERYSRTEYRRRSKVAVPVVHGEPHDGFRILEARSGNPTAELRAAILDLEPADTPVIIRRRYDDTDLTTLAVKAAADLGPVLLDGLADGIWIDAPAHDEETIREVELMILQAARVRFSHTEYIACPSCGRTLYDIEQTLGRIKARTSHLKNLRIGVMGCIVNGPGEMADADYGYVGAGPGRITLYRGREVVERNIPQEEALDRLVELIKADGAWQEP